MTKKAIFLLAVTICGLSLHAETFDKYVGIQGAYGKETKSPGLGIHVAEDWGCHFRTNLSFNYFFKHNGITHLGGDIEWNYLLNLGKHWRLGPLTGVGAYLSWWEQEEHVGMTTYKTTETGIKVGLNLGGSMEFRVNERWAITGDVCCQFISGKRRPLFYLGISRVL